MTDLGMDRIGKIERSGSPTEFLDFPLRGQDKDPVGIKVGSEIVEELIVVLEGAVEARLGDEVRTVGADHTLAIPANVPHAFTVVGDAGAKLLVYFPVPDPFDRTTYLEGSRPEGI